MTAHPKRGDRDPTPRVTSTPPGQDKLLELWKRTLFPRDPEPVPSYRAGSILAQRRKQSIMDVSALREDFLQHAAKGKLRSGVFWRKQWVDLAKICRSMRLSFGSYIAAIRSAGCIMLVQ